MTASFLITSSRVGLFAAFFALTAGTAAAQIPNTLLHSVPPPPAGVQREAGFSVAMDGAYAVAGFPFDDTGARDSGVVKVFDSTTGALLFLLPNPAPAVNNYFGYSVAISGTRVVVGAYNDDVEEPDEDGAVHRVGSAYVYDLISGVPTVPATTLNNPSPTEGDSFGFVVSISGSMVVIGAPFDELVDDEEPWTGPGTVYVYDLAGKKRTRKRQVSLVG